MTTYPAPGLTADWLNGWLAAIGCAVLVPGLQLAWSEDAIPSAVFDAPGVENLPAEIAKRLPDADDLARCVVAGMPRTVTLLEYRARAAAERQRHDGHLAATVADLSEPCDEANLSHAPLDPPGTGPVGALWDRALRCASFVTDPENNVRSTLAGMGRRVKANGLGFDARRLSTGVHPSGDKKDKWVDPIIELLDWSALKVFPFRANGRFPLQRGWSRRVGAAGESFTWPAWRPFLDIDAIDAALDMPQLWRPPMTVATYRSVSYRWIGDDKTRAFFSERVT